MNIFELIEERKSKRRYTSDKASAIDIFDKQREAVKSISDTAGFQEIRNYWIRELEASQTRLMTMKDERELKGVQAEMKIASGFLEFINNITAT